MKRLTFTILAVSLIGTVALFCVSEPKTAPSQTNEHSITEYVTEQTDNQVATQDDGNDYGRPKLFKHKRRNK